MHPRLKIRLRGISAEGRAHLEAHRMYSVEDIVRAAAQPNFFNSSLISGLSTTDTKTLIGILPRCIELCSGSKPFHSQMSLVSIPQTNSLSGSVQKPNYLSGSAQMNNSLSGSAQMNNSLSGSAQMNNSLS
eukprot:Selendium_serpulae@DN6520_c5_g3_i10.p1